MASLNTFSAFGQRARTLIIIAMLAIGLAGAPLAINAFNTFNTITTTQTPHIAAPQFSAPGATSPLADATPNLRCGGVASPC